MIKKPRKKNLKRYKRSDSPPAMQLTQRDHNIVKCAGAFRLVSHRQFCALFPQSEENIKRRLKLLFHNGYLQRPEAQYVPFREGGGSAPVVSAIDSRGIALLKERGDYCLLKTARNTGKIKLHFINHQLLITDLAVSLIVSTRDNQAITLVAGSFMQKFLPQKTREKAKTYQLTARVRLGATLQEKKLEPDYSFLLSFGREGQKTKQQFYFVEIDVGIGSMPMERSDMAQSSLLKKFLIYDAYRQSKKSTTEFKVSIFRVLIITSTTARIKTMQSLLKKYRINENMFWFTTHQGLRDDMLSHKFYNGAGEVKTLGLKV